MKKYLFMLAASVLSTITFAQKVKEKDLPADVKTAFQKLYPDVKKAKWEKEKEYFEAEFEMKESDVSVLFDAFGNLVETEVEIEVDQLPSSSKAYLAKSYPSQKVKEASKITDAKGKVTFEAELKGKEVFFESDGSFIREEIEKP